METLDIFVRGLLRVKAVTLFLSCFFFFFPPPPPPLSLSLSQDSARFANLIKESMSDMRELFLDSLQK